MDARPPAAAREAADPVRGTVLGVAVETYRSDAFRDLPGARSQLAALCALLADHGYEPTVLTDPGREALRAAVDGWRSDWASGGGHGPAVVVWSGHGVLDERELRLPVHDTQDVRDEEQTYSTGLLASAALRSGADQILLLVDTCHAGAGVLTALRKALAGWSAASLPPGRAAWIGVVAGCGPMERADADGVLVDTVARVLREGPDGTGYRHEWSARNEGVTGAAVIRAVLRRWPADAGQLPVTATLGDDRPMFGNPRGARRSRDRDRTEPEPPELVEHLVRAARGADRVAEGWFFTGRVRVLGEIVGWLRERRPGLFLVAGGAGSGKSAVLGRIATLSDARHRPDVPPPGATDPGEGAVDVSLHLRGLTVRRLAELIADRLGLAAPATPAALIADVERKWAGGLGPVLLLDGLDEAGQGQAAPIVEELLAPLSRLGRVLLASRDRAFGPHAEPGEPLHRTVGRVLGARARAVDLDAEPDTGADIAAYAGHRLRAGGVPAAAADGAADRIAGRAAGNGGFLYARTAVDSVLRRGADASSPRCGADASSSAVSLPESVAAAIVDDLASGPRRVRDGVVLPRAARDLLTALAWASGGGMPARGVWEAAASACGDGETAYGPEDLDWVLNAYGHYIVEDGDGTQAVYRLYHREYVARLRELSPPGTALAIARALVALLRERLGEVPLAHVNRYLLGALPDHAVTAGTEGIGLLRDLARAEPGLFRSELARALGMYAVALSGRGRRAEALAPSGEAAELYRALAKSDPGAFLPDLSTCLTNLAAHRSEAGERRAALDAAAEAVAIRRALVRTDAAAHSPGLAAALANLAVAVGEAGDSRGALAAAAEATALYGELAAASPGAQLANLAMVLCNLGGFRMAAGDADGAVRDLTGGIELYRRLVPDRPDAHRPALARALVSLASVLREVGERAAALDAAAEAVALCRALAADLPSAYRPYLAKALSVLATLQQATGDLCGALAAAAETVDLGRALAAEHPSAHLPSLAKTLSEMSQCRARAGDRRGALDWAAEAVGLYRALAGSDPDRPASDLALALAHLSCEQRAAGQPYEALASAVEAADIERALHDADPGPRRHWLAQSLNNVAIALTETGRPESAAETSEEVVGLYRELAAAAPAAHLPRLTTALTNHARYLAEAGHHDLALESTTEAVALARRLAARDPGAHPDQLVNALHNLATNRSRTGDAKGALACAEEALALLRPAAAAHPDAQSPTLAMALSNLATYRSLDGDRTGALTAAEEAVALRRRLADEHPAAFRPVLAKALTNLAVHRAQTDDPAGAVAAATESLSLLRALAADAPEIHLPPLENALRLRWRISPDADALALHLGVERELAAHQGAVRRLTLTRADVLLHALDPEAGLRVLTALLAAPPVPSPNGDDPVLIPARQLLRQYRRTDEEAVLRVAAAWRAATGEEPPEWFDLTGATLDLVSDWVNSSGWVESRDFWVRNAARLASPEAATALAELALAHPVGLVHQRIARTAAELGPDEAFRPYVTHDLLDQWLGCADWDESRVFLASHAAELLHESVLQLLGEDPEDLEWAVHGALVRIARAEGVDAAYACVADRAHLAERVRSLLTDAPPAPLLRAFALLELGVYEEEFTASLHLRIYAALDGDGAKSPPPDPLPAAPPEARERAVAELAGLVERAPGHAVALGRILRDALAAPGAPG